MHSRRAVLRFLVVVSMVVAGTAYMLTKEPVRGIDLHSRLLSSAPLPTEMTESCTWDTASEERPALQRAPGGTADRGPAMGDPVVAQRMPLRLIAADSDGSLYTAAQ